MSDHARIGKPTRRMTPSLTEIRREVGSHWSDENLVKAVISPCWRALMMMGRTAAEPDSFFSLSAIWEAAGSPSEFDPQVHYAAGDIIDPTDGIAMGTVEHRGDRVFADWCTAAWYAHLLDPDVISPNDVARILV